MISKKKGDREKEEKTEYTHASSLLYVQTQA